MKEPAPTPATRQTAKIIPIRPDVKPIRPRKHKDESTISVPRGEHMLFSKLLYVLTTDSFNANFIRYYVNYYANKVEQKTNGLNPRP